MTGQINNYFYDFFKCSCHCTEHQFILGHFIDEGPYPDDYYYVSIRLLSDPRWYKRLWYAIKYVFKYDVAIDYDEIILSKEDTVRLYTTLGDRLKNN